MSPSALEVRLRDELRLAERRQSIGYYAAVTRLVGGSAAVVASLTLLAALTLLVGWTILTAILLVFDLLAIIVGGLIAWICYRVLKEAVFVPVSRLMRATTPEANDKGSGLGEVGTGVASDISDVVNRMAMVVDSADRERKMRLVKENRIAASGERMMKMARAFTRISESLDRDKVYARVVEEATAQSHFERATLWLVDADGSGLNAVCDSSGTSPNPATLRAGEGVAGRAWKGGQAVLVRPSGDEAMTRYACVLENGMSQVGVLEVQTAHAVDETVIGDAAEAVTYLGAHAVIAITACGLHEEVERRGELDVLTRLSNRRRLDEDLRNEVARSVRYAYPLSVVMVDVDHFKSVNDTYGHQKGDDVLRGVGRALATYSRETDIAYRYGGEEFFVLLPNTELSVAFDVADRLRVSVTQHITQLNAIPREVTISLGVAAISGHTRTPEGLIQAADTALYAAKQGGRNRVVAADPT